MINTEEKNKVSIMEILKGINWNGVVLCIVAFFVGRINFFGGFYTLAIAYIGAMCFSKQVASWSSFLAILGMLSSSQISENLIKYILVILLLEGFRLCMRMVKSQYNVKNQSVLVGISILVISLMTLFIKGITVLNIVICLLEAAVGVGLVHVLSYSMQVIYKKRTTPLTEQEMASMGLLFACLLGGMIDFYVIIPVFNRIFFKDVFIFFMIIAIIFLGRMSAGIIMTLTITTVLVVMGYIPTQFVAIYLVAALLGGAFCFLERVGIVFATGLGLLLGFALFNNRIVDLPILGAYLTASVLSLCVPRSYFGLSNWFGYGMEVSEEKHLMHIQQIMTERLNHFSKAFKDLSKTFERISDKEIYMNQGEINHIIEEAGENMCKECSMKHFCWEDYLKDTYNSGYEMLEIINTKGQITVGDIPPHFKKSCANAESFAYTLGFKMDLFKQKRVWQKRFVETRKLISQNFDAVARSVENLSTNIQSEFYFNKEDEEHIKEILHIRGIRTKDIMVLESNGRKEEIHVYTYYKGETDLKEKLVLAVQEALELPIDLEKYTYYTEDKYCYFKLRIKKQYSVLAGAAVAAKGEVSGDVYSFMELNDGNYLLALADGMGSGRLANEESTATIELLESFMDSGFNNETAVKMINSALVLKSDIENYSTMDITLIDEYTGVAEFLKLGASTSFIVRGDEVTTVKASSLPIGILDKVDIVSCKKQLKDGDLIIMVTDGILESRNQLMAKEETFKHFILEAKTNSPEYLAQYLLDKAMTLLVGEEKDDMTVVVARVWKQYD